MWEDHSNRVDSTRDTFTSIVCGVSNSFKGQPTDPLGTPRPKMFFLVNLPNKFSSAAAHYPPAFPTLQIDNGLGALRGMLEELGEWDNTVVVFFSDNGGLASHGSVNRPFRGGKGDYWEGGVHVPAFVSGGFVSAALKRNGVEPYRYGHLTHVTDIHATVLRLAGCSSESEGEGGLELDGFDLWEAMVQTQAAARQAVVINLNSPNFASSGAVRWGKYKLIRNPEPIETVIYSRVQSKLVGEGLVVSEVKSRPCSVGD